MYLFYRCSVFQIEWGYLKASGSLGRFLNDVSGVYPGYDVCLMSYISHLRHLVKGNEVKIQVNIIDFYFRCEG